MFALLSLLSVGQVAHAQSVQPLSKEEIMKNLAAETKRLDGILQNIELKYTEGLRKAGEDAIVRLKSVARREAGSGAIPSATAAWTEVIKIDANDEDAARYFDAIGKSDIVEQEKENQRQEATSTTPQPQWKRVWMGEDRRNYYLVAPGVWELRWEKDGEAKKLTFQELERTPDSVTLFHREPGYKAIHQLYSGHQINRFGNQNTWQIGPKGYWQQ
ncbi:hypothetical protein GC197_04420 [bacterium]|nr:hypothetical protein [bacterium]